MAEVPDDPLATLKPKTPLDSRLRGNDGSLNICHPRDNGDPANG